MPMLPEALRPEVTMPLPGHVMVSSASRGQDPPSEDPGEQNGVDDADTVHGPGGEACGGAVVLLSPGPQAEHASPRMAATSRRLDPALAISHMRGPSASILIRIAGSAPRGRLPLNGR
jgi:hypothetical protein